jgi:hypothetical protein
LHVAVRTDGEDKLAAAPATSVITGLDPVIPIRWALRR